MADRDERRVVLREKVSDIVVPPSLVTKLYGVPHGAWEACEKSAQKIEIVMQ